MAPGYWASRRRVRYARNQAEEAWFTGEAAILKKVYEAAIEGDFGRADDFKAYLVGSPYERASEHRSVVNLESQHEKFLDKWRVGITIALVMALFIVLVLIVLQSGPNTAAAPYVSLLSGLAGIALGWMFANAAGGRTNGRPSGGDASEMETP